MISRIKNSILGWMLLAVLLLSIVVACSLKGAEPHIDRIDLFSTNYVLLHFDTIPNKKNILQYTGTLGSSSNWINIQVFDPEPGVTHWVWPDTRVSTQRFFRLI